MKLAIMQPYFFPYIGYFQLMRSVDKFVVYDNIKFSKGGWIQRNRILSNCADRMISLPLKSDSDFLDICQRRLADSYDKDRIKMLKQIKASYRRALFFPEVMKLIERSLNYENRNLFHFILHALLEVRQYLNIGTEIIVSSEVSANHSLRGSDRVIAICEALAADHYINPMGGLELYSKKEFADRGIKLSFINSTPIIYKQFNDCSFVSSLSIIDVMMFNSIEQISKMLNGYELL